MGTQMESWSFKETDGGEDQSVVRALVGKVQVWLASPTQGNRAA